MSKKLIFHTISSAALAGLKAMAERHPKLCYELLPVLKKHYPIQLIQAAVEVSAIQSVVVSGKQGVFEGCPSDYSVLYKYAVEGEWASQTLGEVLAFFEGHESGTYIDIGANIGLTAVPMACSGIKTIAFEATSKNFSYLESNVRRAGVSEQLIAYQLALSDQPGEVEFELSPSNHGDHRLRGASAHSLIGEDAWETERVQADTLDSVLKDLAEPVAIKLDVQGAEPFVFAGGIRVFSAASMIICEFSPYSMHRMGANPDQLISYLSSFDEISLREAESTEIRAAESNAGLVPFLRDYFDRYKMTPYGKYLDVICKNKVER